MGTDIHLQAERKLADGAWWRIPHAPQPCTSCAEYDRDTGEYGEPRGWFNPWLTRDDLTPEDIILEESQSRGRVRVDRREPCYRCHGNKIIHPEWLKDRNYDVFAILANVRNGTGFAGIKTSSGFDPIDTPRGLPDDLSAEVVAHLKRLGQRVEGGEIIWERQDDEEGEDIYEEMEKERDGYWSFGEHSFSWVALSEIVDYDWERGVVKEGWVDPWNYELWRTEGRPSSWSGGVSGQSIEHISDTQMGDMIDSGNIQWEGDPPPAGSWEDRPYSTSLTRAMGEWNLPDGSVGQKIREGQKYYCLVKWIVPYRDCVGEHFFKEIERLKEFAPEGDYSRVRLVFGFDS